MTEQEQYYELSYYTLSHVGTTFLHQHIVDAYSAQTAGINTKPISIMFSLAGLYLFVEKDYTGKQVQQAHRQMAKNKIAFPEILLPIERGEITVSDVLAAQPGPERDDMIGQWCVSVWEAFSTQHNTIISITEMMLDK